MIIELGRILPVLEEWRICVEECRDECICCVENLSGVEGVELEVLAIYLCAWRSRRYQLVAASHLHALRNRVAIDPEKIASAKKTAKIILRIEPYDINWETVFWRGLCYAHVFVDMERLVVVKIKPPSNKTEREKLRVLLEGKRVTLRRRTYHVGGLIKRLGGKKLAPWIYLVSKKDLHKLAQYIGSVDIEVYQ